ncbi:thioredoxin-related transmembrane protein 1 [Trichonephila clavipes]|nr:thioredoxin-related transmembrane protein 1 [Trichonephila clavipes]
MLTGEWMVEFYAPWCPACQQLQPLWKEYGEWSDDLGIKVGSVDVTLNPGLSGRFMIAALPTIFQWPIYDKKSEECSSIQPASSQLGFVRGTLVLLENSITVGITEQHKQMGVITQQLYLPNCIEGGWYMHQRSQTVPQKNTPDMIEPPCPGTVTTWHAGSIAS